MKNEIKNKLVKYLANNKSDVVYITSEERKNELFSSVIDEEEVHLLFVESRKIDTVSLSELCEMTKFEYYSPICSFKTFVIDDIRLLLSDIEFDDIFYKYKYIAEQLSKISTENYVNIILFDNNIKIAFYEYSDFCFGISDNGNFKCLKNRDGSDFVNGSDYIRYIAKNLSNLNYIVFKNNNI